MEPETKRAIRPRVRVIVSVLFLSALLLLIAKGILFASRFVLTTGLTPTTVARLAFDTGSPLRQTEGRTNLLLLGISGGNHAGSQLTDTMLIVSLDATDQSLAMISVPRDIWSDTLQDRVNSAYYYGEEKKQGGGMTLAKAIIEDMTGLTLHYGLVIDFTGFTQVIDAVGGIDVNVPAAFVDPEFPIAGKEDDECDGDPTYACRYETLRFEAGTQHMDGETALKYVRSRHAQGDEGTDFARGKRQQEVLLALKTTLSNPGLWISPGKSREILDSVDRAVDSDMSLGELLTVGKLIARGTGETRQISIEDQLYVPPTSWYGRYVLLPKESFEEIHAYLRDQLED